MPMFKNFDYSETRIKTLIKCRKCDAPKVDWETEEGKKHYSRTSYVSPINDTCNDISLSCISSSCDNEETVEGISAYIGLRIV